MWEKKEKNNFDFFFKHRDIKPFTTEIRRNYLVSEPSSHTTKFFTQISLAKETKKKTKPKNRETYE